MLNRLFLVPLLALTLAAPSQAGLFKKSAKPDPATHVPALIEILKTDKEERARSAAAGELDEYDAKTYPEILPALMEALTSDPSTSVRSKAAESIGKVRPISAAAGYALERAAADDKSTYVRLSAKAALMKYRILGHMPGTKMDFLAQSSEPPLAGGPTIKGVPGGTVLRPTPPPIPVTGPVTIPPVVIPPGPELPPGSQSTQTKPVDPQTGEPPLADSGKPALTNTPKAPVPVIVIPSAPTKDTIIPIPTVPSTGGPALPPKN